MDSYSSLHIADRAQLAAAFARIAEASAADAVAQRGRFTLAVPGGSVIDVLGTAFARVALPWKNVHVFWCDERAVPADAPESNARQFRDALKGTPMAGALHPMPAAEPDLERAAMAYEHDLAEVCGEGSVLDLVLLGVGEDGHIASLFPGHAALDERTRNVIPVFDSPKPPPRRLTLTIPMLARARTVVVAAFGTGKAALMRDIIGRTRDVPITRLLAAHPRATFLLDHDAASLLAPTASAPRPQ